MKGDDIAIRATPIQQHDAGHEYYYQHPCHRRKELTSEWGIEYHSKKSFLSGSAKTVPILAYYCTNSSVLFN